MIKALDNKILQIQMWQRERRAIAKRIVNAYGGELSIQSYTTGGTVVNVQLAVANLEGSVTDVLKG
ncbi:MULTISPECIES: hypothetical protein [Fischerella]|uniref:Uncharacterized protein n=1 Tax=Fischerella muscicola CCMEE 5323 TaxID=2019572 RepID=A0A2N6K3B3_FISMU|nr:MULTISPECIES: hypothetical protein [Fischerella]MBD2430277.1 hypothetical protein [Fischerella sp. FACHB-380]PLZ90016.1 hypothetical protein CEN44_11790 [Fischerella muscicola CCMEE 5323]